jgi:hypothetical protein
MLRGFFLNKSRIFPVGYVLAIVLIFLIPAIVIADSEPNNSIDEADLITLSQQVSGILDHSSDEFDYYNISLEADIDYIASLDGPDDADFDIGIYDKNGSQVAGTTDDWDSDENIIYLPAEAGYYFVRIWAYDGNGSYTMNVNVPKTTSENSYSLIDAMDNGYINIEITGVYDGSEESFDLKNGRNVFYGQCNIITIESLVANDLDIIIPAGLILKSLEEEVEDKVITLTQTINVPSLSQKESKLYAMSINLYKNIPILFTEFEVGTMATGDLLKIAELINTNNHQTPSGQVAVWMVSDNAQSTELEQIGATSSMITSAKAMLINAGITPPTDDSTETDDDGFFGPFTNWICPVSIIIIVVLMILGAIGRRSRAKKAPSPGPTMDYMKPMPYSVQPSQSKKGPTQRIPHTSESTRIPPKNLPPNQLPPPPPPPPPKTEKVEPVAYPQPKKPKKGN